MKRYSCLQYSSSCEVCNVLEIVNKYTKKNLLVRFTTNEVQYSGILNRLHKLCNILCIFANLRRRKNVIMSLIKSCRLYSNDLFRARNPTKPFIC